MDTSNDPLTREVDLAGESLDHFPKPSVAVDVAVLTVAPSAWMGSGGADGGGSHPTEGTRRVEPPSGGPDDPTAGRLELAVLLLRRAADPHAGSWGLPGSMVREKEPLADAVLRTLVDKCGIEGLAPRQLRVLDNPDRDDRGWVISVAHLDVVPPQAVGHLLGTRDDLALAPVTLSAEHPTSAGSSAPLDLPGGQAGLPFDHAHIVELAVDDLRHRYREAPDPAHLVAEPFTLLELRRVHEAVLGRELQKDTFRRQVLAHLTEVEDLSRGSVGRPARRYRRTAME